MVTSIEPKFGNWNADILKAAFRTDGRDDGFISVTPPSWILLVGPRQVNAAMLAAIARLGESCASAPHGAKTANGGLPAPVCPDGHLYLRYWRSQFRVPQAQVKPPWPAVRVLDGGNRFNAYTVARLLGGRPEVLERITVSRAFTCYQVLALLESTPAMPCAFVVLDLLNTFYDESVQAGERKRLLRACLAQLERLGQSSKGVVSVHPPKVPSQAAVEMLTMLQAKSQDTIFIQPEPAAPEPLRLF